jgi:3',5'-cyclic AMP phosphodiesterase CpdA
MAFRVFQISDTHLSPDGAWFVPNFSAVTALVADRRPDLVINTGDVAMDGSHRDEDLAFARRCHDGLAVPWLAIPGNHDIGDNPWKAEIPDPVSEERVTRYRRHFGDDHWRVDAGAWVLVGVNVQLFGSGLAAETEQWAFIAAAARDAGRRPVALFIHKPLFKDEPGETAVDGRYVPPESRHRLQASLRDADVRLVASGHVHQHRQHRHGGVSYAWAPSTAYVLPDRRQPRIGTKHVGYVAYTFDGDAVDVEIVEPPALANHDADQFPDLYRRH